VVFTAPAQAVTLTVYGIPSGSFPVTFYADAVLVEEGELLGDYFDGNTGGGDDDYLWETGGTPGLARSYYYPEYDVNYQTIADILARHIPVGLTPAIPLFAVPPTQ
jgi:hypothetical protein